MPSAAEQTGAQASAGAASFGAAHGMTSSATSPSRPAMGALTSSRAMLVAASSADDASSAGSSTPASRLSSAPGVPALRAEASEPGMLREAATARSWRWQDRSHAAAPFRTVGEHGALAPGAIIWVGWSSRGPHVQGRWSGRFAERALGRCGEHGTLGDPVELPLHWRGIAAEVTGRTGTRYTTGPATRGALGAAGALGATTGRVIHLRAHPRADLSDAAVIAHELAHARRPLPRPRFLLPDRHGQHDDEERFAAERGESAAAGLGALLSANGRFPAPGSTGELPVGGTGAAAAASVAASVARSVLSEAFGGDGQGGAAGRAGAADSGAGAMAATNASAPGVALPAFGAGTTAATATAVPGPSAAEGDPDGGAAAGASPAAAQGGAGSALDLDELVASLEDRLIRDLERRGGRYEGVF